jgi:GTP:adenosylcobinamide-phosphate guanylyltransferase
MRPNRKFEAQPLNLAFARRCLREPLALLRPQKMYDNPFGHPVPAIVLAGQRPGKDPLAVWAGAPFKAAIEVDGRSMIERVCSALLSSPWIGEIYILTQQPDQLRPALGPLRDQSRLHFVVSAATISDSLISALSDGALATPVLVTTADHALLTPEIISQFLNRSKPPLADVTVALVEKRTVLRRYPGNKRTWLKFRDGWFTGANLFCFKTREAMAGLRFWRAIEQDRKKGWKLAAAFGPVVLFQFLLRRLTLQRAFLKAGKVIGIDVAPVVLDSAEAAIDVDKPEDHRIAELILKARTIQGR